MINVSPDALRKETVAVMAQVNSQIQDVQRVAAGKGVSPTSLRDENGSWVMAPMLLAKTQCLATLTQLNDQSRKR